VDPIKSYFTVTEQEYLKSQMAKEYVEILPVVASDGSRRVVGVLSPIDIFREQISRARAGTPAVLGNDSSSPR